MSRLDDLRVLALRLQKAIREEEARTRQRPRTRRTTPEHGTDSGYHWHRRHRLPYPEDQGGEPCGCREAHAAYEQIRHRERRAS